ncbi:MAG TPA: DNA/RNA helicase domain-containing protein [Candidatus Paceibacterota bacterium]|nr:DNA/RNA helicase domain-containing protein [Candidatus Paceibacterota bacterium]
MIQVETFPFEKDKFEQLKNFHYGLDWPVVYIQENGHEMYIGETTDVYTRSKQHIADPDRARLKKIHIITDEEFNKSANLDLEALLIQYISAEGKYKLQNGNEGLINHNYYDKPKYRAKFESLWEYLKGLNLVNESLEAIRNSDFFKFSPYKALTEDQLIIAQILEKSIEVGNIKTHIVNGGPGTGKSVLALYLLKRLKDGNPDLKIALVISMTSLRSTLQRVVKRIPGLGSETVIGPSDVIKEKYDLLIVDEAHRLRRRVNLANFGSYDALNRAQGFDKDATQLDWIVRSSKQQILFYDKNQTVVPADVREEDFQLLNAEHYYLTSQMRVQGGEDYLKFIDDLFELKKTHFDSPKKYEFEIFSDIGKMIDEIKKKNHEHSLSRVVAGYAWPWTTKKGKGEFDIEIDGVRLLWNSKNIDWVNSGNSINEVGCIHTIQGYDLNYVAVIIGPELSYDERRKKLIVEEEKYKDINGKRSISDPAELERYVINIYKTLLTRGIKGTYIYIVDEKLRKKFRELITA